MSHSIHQKELHFSQACFPVFQPCFLSEQTWQKNYLDVLRAVISSQQTDGLMQNDMAAQEFVAENYLTLKFREQVFPPGNFK